MLEYNFYKKICLARAKVYIISKKKSLVLDSILKDYLRLIQL